ncbi:MAG: type II toxin-antitoxin system VapB family antitoxin [Defluviitaleaceae bacterium]|nr:type II toxin-antitoxin system VapB family antitoxin [Defluviitaleaceae bacterium]
MATIVTSIKIDKNLMDNALKLSQEKTKKGTIEIALREFVQKRQQKDLRDLRGQIKFADGYDKELMSDYNHDGEEVKEVCNAKY